MLTGIALALLSSLLWAASDGSQKALVGLYPPVLFAALLACGQVPLLGLWLAASGAPQPEPLFWGLTALSALLNFVALLLYLRALKLSPLSLTIPYLCLTTVFMLGTSWWILAEVPSALGALGVVLVAAGAVLLGRDEGPGTRQATRRPWRERGSLLMIAVAALWSLTGCLDKLAVQASSPAFYLFMLHLMMAAPLVLLLARQGSTEPWPHWPRLWLVALVVVVTGGAFLLQFESLRHTLAVYTMAIKRTDVLFSVLIGCVWFGERGLRQRLPAAALMVAGAVLIALLG